MSSIRIIVRSNLAVNAGSRQLWETSSSEKGEPNTNSSKIMSSLIMK